MIVIFMMRFYTIMIIVQVMIVLEYMEKGDLRKYLLAKRPK